MLHNRERVSLFVREHGDKRLDRVTPEDALEFHRLHGARTMVVRAAFNDAIKARQIEENPFGAVEVKKSRGRRDITVLTDSEVHQLMATAARVHGEFGEAVFAPMIAVAAGTGCRPGENFALAREDIDLEQQSVHIWQQWNGRLRKYTTLKGTRLDRRVEMLPVAVDALRRAELPASGVIWRTVRDVPFKARELTYYWPAVRDSFVSTLPDSHHLQRRLREEIPGGRLDFHELRHYFGTALARAGCSELEIMDQMGHEDSQTARIYIHLTNSDVRTSVREKLRRAA
jgi:integrase